MAAMDEFRKEREAIKNATLKQKLSYFWDYYKWYVVIPLIIIIMVGNTIYHKLTDPETILNGVLLNCYNMEKQDATLEFMESFYEAHDIDTKEYKADFNTTLSYSTDENAASSNYSTMQVLMAWTGAGTLDFLTGNLDAMVDLSYRSYFVDLTSVLTEEQIKQYEPYFLYMDEAVIEKRSEAFDKGEDTESIPVPDATKPETMEKPIPVMIDMSQSGKLTEVYGDSGNALTFGIVANAPNTDMVLNFIDFLME